MDRKLLSSLKGRTIHTVEEVPNSNYLHLCDDQGAFAMVNRDDLFDEDGSRFLDDLT